MLLTVRQTCRDSQRYAFRSKVIWTRQIGTLREPERRRRWLDSTGDFFYLLFGGTEDILFLGNFFPRFNFPNKSGRICRPPILLRSALNTKPQHNRATIIK